MSALREYRPRDVDQYGGRVVHGSESADKVALEDARPLGPLFAVVRVADGVSLCVPAHVRHSDCLGASVSVLPGPGGCGASLRGSGRLVAPSGGSTVSGQRRLTR